MKFITKHLNSLNIPWNADLSDKKRALEESYSNMLKQEEIGDSDYLYRDYRSQVRKIFKFWISGNREVGEVKNIEIQENLFN